MKRETEISRCNSALTRAASSSYNLKCHDIVPNYKWLWDAFKSTLKVFSSKTIGNPLSDDEGAVLRVFTYHKTLEEPEESECNDTSLSSRDS